MTKPLHGARLRRRAALLLAFYWPACSSWQTGGPAPAESVETKAPVRVRVTRLDSSTVVLLGPWVHGDSVVGTLGQGLARSDTARQLSMPFSDVSSVAVHRFSTGRTLGLAGGIFGAIAILEVISCASSDSDYVC